MLRELDFDKLIAKQHEKVKEQSNLNCYEEIVNNCQSSNIF